MSSSDGLASTSTEKTSNRVAAGVRTAGGGGSNHLGRTNRTNSSATTTSGEGGGGGGGSLVMVATSLANPSSRANSAEPISNVRTNNSFSPSFPFFFDAKQVDDGGGVQIVTRSNRSIRKYSRKRRLVSVSIKTAMSIDWAIWVTIGENVDRAATLPVLFSTSGGMWDTKRRIRKSFSYNIE